MQKRRQWNGAALKERREALGKSKEWEALGIGRSVQSITLYERGVCPPPHVIGALADLLGCAVDDFFEPAGEEVVA